MSVFKPLAAIAAMSLIVVACSKKEETVVEGAVAPPAVDASAMSGTAPTTVNPTPDATGAMTTGDGAGAMGTMGSATPPPATGTPPNAPTPTQTPAPK